MQTKQPAGNNNISQEEIGLRIQNLRKEKGLTIEDLARRCNLSIQSICKIESGTRSFKVQSLIALSQSLGVSSDYILGLSSYSEIDNISFLLSSLSNEGVSFIMIIA